MLLNFHFLLFYFFFLFFFFNDTATTEIYTFPYTTLFRSIDAERLGQRSRHRRPLAHLGERVDQAEDRKSTRLNSSHPSISYAVFCLKKKKKKINSED